MTWVLQNSPTTGSDKLILIGLANHADPIGENAYPAVGTLARYANLEVRAVQNALRRLEAAGHITVAIGAGGDYRTAPDRRPNRYSVAMSAAQIAKNRADHQKSGVQSSTPRDFEKRGAVQYRTGCSPVPNGVQSSTERGAADCTQTVLEPSLNQQQPFDEIFDESLLEPKAAAVEFEEFFEEPQRLEPKAAVGSKQPDLERRTGDDGKRQLGVKDIPAAGGLVGLEAETPAAALAQFLGSTRCKSRYPTDHAIYLESRERWLSSLPAEFIRECLALAQRGEGVERSPFGAVIKWLEQPASSPLSALEIFTRATKGLSARLERLPNRYYRSRDGRVVWAKNWMVSGECETDTGLIPAAATRLWTLMPEDWQPEQTPQRETAAPRPERVTGEKVSELLQTATWFKRRAG